MGQRLSVRELADHLGLSSARIYQKIEDGTLTKGTDRKIDLDQALAWHQRAVLTHPIQTLATAHSNGGFTTAPKGLSPAAAEAMSDEEFDRMMFGEEPAPAEPAPPAPRTATEGLVDNASEVVRLRAVKLAAEIERTKLKAQIEAGLLIEKGRVRDYGIEAGKTIKSLLEALPAEIASVFADPERRSEVRAKVQERVDQMIYRLHAALASAAGDP